MKEWKNYYKGLFLMPLDWFFFYHYRLNKILISTQYSWKFTIVQPNIFLFFKMNSWRTYEYFLPAYTLNTDKYLHIPVAFSVMTWTYNSIYISSMAQISYCGCASGVCMIITRNEYNVKCQHSLNTMRWSSLFGRDQIFFELYWIWSHPIIMIIS